MLFLFYIFFIFIGKQGATGEIGMPGGTGPGGAAVRKYIQGPTSHLAWGSRNLFHLSPQTSFLSEQSSELYLKGWVINHWSKIYIYFFKWTSFLPQGLNGLPGQPGKVGSAGVTVTPRETFSLKLLIVLCLVIMAITTGKYAYDFLSIAKK